VDYYRQIQAQLIEKGRNLGFTDDQLQFIVETASTLAQVTVITPPADENGAEVRLPPGKPIKFLQAVYFLLLRRRFDSTFPGTNYCAYCIRAPPVISLALVEQLA
jgi:hypothetical protein